MSDVKKPSGSEEEYFAREEIKRKEQARIKLDHEERELLKKVHWRRCPNDGHEMLEIPFRDTTIVRCTFCKGVFIRNEQLQHLAGSDGNILQSIFAFFKEDRG